MMIIQVLLPVILFISTIFSICSTIVLTDNENFIVKQISIQKYNEGIGFMSNKDYTNALNSFKESVRLSLHIKAVNSVIICLKALSLDHLEWLKQLLEVHPNDIEIKFTLALETHYLGRYNDAIHLYKELIVHHNDIAEIWFSLGVSYQYAGMVEESSSSYIRCLYLDDQHSRCRLNLASLHVQFGVPYDSIHHFELLLSKYQGQIEVSQLVGEYGMIVSNLGIAYLKSDMLFKVNIM
jgi:tetratricopeptide (TPR) repeat protein